MNLLKGLYHHACAQVCHNDSWIVIINFLSGVLQGCPGSAFFFNSALDLFLLSTDRALSTAHTGIARACADDIGGDPQEIISPETIAAYFQSCQGTCWVKPEAIQMRFGSSASVQHYCWRKIFTAGFRNTSQPGVRSVLGLRS